MKTFKPDLELIFSGIHADEWCEDCPYLRTYIETHEIWGCKERTQVLDCSGSAIDCPRAKDEAEDVQAWMDDNSAMLELII